MVGAAGGAVWLLGEVLTGLGKTVMAVIAGGAVATVGVILVVAMAGAVQNRPSDASTATTATPAVSQTPAATPLGGTTTGQPDRARPRLRLIRGGRAA
ncbi:MAG: hypothetical protein ACRD0P_15530 [Stackebrandtia sp.]